MADDDEIWASGENWGVLEATENLQGTDQYDPDVFYVNPKAYSRWPLDHFVKAAHDGDIPLLEKMLDRENPIDGYHADINAHADGITALQAAAVNGQLEAVEMLLRARADPHVKAWVPTGKDPKDGETARDVADKWGWDDIVDVLKGAEEETPRGVYNRCGAQNNAKLWPIDRPQGLDPAQEKRAMKSYRGMVRPLPSKADRKFYGDAVFGVTHGYDESGRVITGRRGVMDIPEEPAARADSEAHWEPWAKAVTHPRPQPQAALASTIGLLFPGQGSQYMKMMDEVKQRPGVQRMLGIAGRVLDFDLLELCLEGPETQLERPELFLPALYVADLAGVEKLREQAPGALERLGALAGLFVGEYAALTVAGVWDFGVGLGLVRACGEAVAAAAREAPQATASVAGLERAALGAICEEAAARAGGGAACHISAELFPKGLTCGGSAGAMEALKGLAEAGGALQCKVQTACGALNTPLMESAREKLQQSLRKALPSMRPPRCDVYMNSTGKAFRKGSDPNNLIPLLCNQLTSPLLWEKCVNGMILAGIDEFYEVGPMRQLKSMMKRIDPAMWSRTKNIEV